MNDLWSDAEAEAAVAEWPRVAPEVARQVHATRLLGADPQLVLHGGGNTSIKTTEVDVDGTEIEVLRVKGSGYDMARMTPEGMPAFRLDVLRRLQGLETLSDAGMMTAAANAAVDATGPAPSVEMLLHAFLPAPVIDHTHANAVLALTNQEGWADVCAEVFGDRVAFVPFVMSGFKLAKTAAEVQAANPDVEGLLVLRHGLFTFGETAKQAYGRMIDLVGRAEARLAETGPKAFPAAGLPARVASLAEVAPVIRGATAEVVDAEENDYRPFILDFRTSEAIRNFVDGRDLADYATRGTGTPDHVIRTKQKPLVLPAPDADDLAAWADAVHEAVTVYANDYRAYFARQNDRVGGDRTMLDPMPRVVLVPGLGLFGLGRSAAEAEITADLAEANVDIIGHAEALGTFRSVSEDDVFDIEYWPLEQAKMQGRGQAPLAGRVCVVTGGASGIGAATARMFAEQGCAVAVLDLDAGQAEAMAESIGGLGLGCDVTDGEAVQACLDRTVETFGGIDVVVSNAGAAWQGRIGEVDAATLRKSFELNFWSHQSVCSGAVRVMQAQGLGGCLLFNTSKQALNPGKNFGPYGLPKAATLFLMKQYALDHGRDGIRANAVNADRIRSGLLTDDMIKSRSGARGVSEKDYMAGNLLGLEVTADDVARAFLHLACARKTSAAILTVDGGNIEASLR